MSYYGKQPPWPWPPEQPHFPKPPKPEPPACPQQPGTLLRVYIPAGAVLNIANLLEVTSPSGICLLLRIPALGGQLSVDSIMKAVQNIGGSVTFE